MLLDLQPDQGPARLQEPKDVVGPVKSWLLPVEPNRQCVWHEAHFVTTQGKEHTVGADVGGGPEQNCIHSVGSGSQEWFEGFAQLDHCNLDPKQGIPCYLRDYWMVL
jgi:hypothetical protein